MWWRHCRGRKEGGRRRSSSRSSHQNDRLWRGVSLHHLDFVMVKDLHNSAFLCCIR